MFTYSEREEFFAFFQEVLYCVRNVRDHAVYDMHHTICSHLVTVDDSGTVYRNNLDRKRNV